MSRLHCRFCRGKSCKYEPDNYEQWLKKKGSERPALKGLYSSWITPSIVAHARPSKKAMDKWDIVGQFKQLGIGAIINCQLAGEHAWCGDGVRASGFSYDPEDFMNNDIFFYNFSWTDMTAPSLDLMLNIVQVMQATIQSGQKIAIHCHAGLGRTGLCIACYLCLAHPEYTAKQAMETVRRNRPGSVQTSTQVKFITRFHAFIHELRQVYPDPGASVVYSDGSREAEKKRKKGKKSKKHEFTLSHALRAQRRYLHGYEKRQLIYLPKVIAKTIYTLSTLVTTIRPHGARVIAQALADARTSSSNPDVHGRVQTLKQAVNADHWQRLHDVDNPVVLVVFLLDYIRLFKQPIIAPAVRQRALESPHDHNLINQLNIPERLIVYECLGLIRQIDPVPAALRTPMVLPLVEALTHEFDQDMTRDTTSKNLLILSHWFLEASHDFELEISKELRYQMLGGYHYSGQSLDKASSGLQQDNKPAPEVLHIYEEELLQSLQRVSTVQEVHPEPGQEGDGVTTDQVIHWLRREQVRQDEAKRLLAR